jgi:hydroxymethylglutaryl-CoA synthase
MGAAQSLMEALGTTPADYQYAIFHQPNVKFPQRVAKMLGFTPEQIAPGLLSPRIGNTYAGSAVIGLTATLDVAEPGDHILIVSYGSGAGSDAFSLRVTERIVRARNQALTTEAYINRRTEIDYATYTRYRGKIKMS